MDSLAEREKKVNELLAKFDKVLKENEVVITRVKEFDRHGKVSK